MSARCMNGHCRLVIWLVDGLVRWLVGWMYCCLYASFAGWLVGYLVSWWIVWLFCWYSLATFIVGVSKNDVLASRFCEGGTFLFCFRVLFP